MKEESPRFPSAFNAFSFALTFLAIFLCVSVKSVCGDESLAARIQKSYEKIEDIEGSFVQKSFIKDLKRTDTFKGTFMIKLPSKMRWRYEGEGKRLTEVIINGDELLIYQNAEKQVLRGKFDRGSYGQAPIALLGGFGKIMNEFEVSEKDGRLLLKPRKPMGSVASIEVVPSNGEFPIGSISITDKRSNKIDITLKSVSVNTGIKDSAFVFSVPKDASVYEYNRQ
jgi:outer membrane lipoprotein carrier protein